MSAFRTLAFALLSWIALLASAPHANAMARAYHFVVSGPSGGAPGFSASVRATRYLSVTVKAGVSGYAISGLPEAHVGFNCEMFTIRANGVSRNVFVKRTSYTDVYRGLVGYDPCQNADTSATVDFSNDLKGDTEPVTVTVSNAYYDNCRLYGDLLHGGCPLSQVYRTHPVDGYINVYSF